MSKVTIFTARWCGYCTRAKALLDGKGIAYEEVNLDDDPSFRQRLHDLTGGWTTPLLLLVAWLTPMTWTGWGAARDAVLATDEQPRAAVRGR